MCVRVRYLLVDVIESCAWLIEDRVHQSSRGLRHMSCEFAYTSSRACYWLSTNSSSNTHPPVVIVQQLLQSALALLLPLLLLLDPLLSFSSIIHYPAGARYKQAQIDMLIKLLSYFRAASLPITSLPPLTFVCSSLPCGVERCWSANSAAQGNIDLLHAFLPARHLMRPVPPANRSACGSQPFAAQPCHISPLNLCHNPLPPVSGHTLCGSRSMPDDMQSARRSRALCLSRQDFLIPSEQPAKLGANRSVIIRFDQRRKLEFHAAKI